MAIPRVLILRAPGTNCDAETAFAFEHVGAQVRRVHVNRLIDDPGLGRGYQILCLPGGFSYGDDIAAGRILAQRLSVHLRELVEEFRQAQRLVLGICNGFQVMLRLGIFFSGEETRPPATLAHNAQNRFEDRWVRLINKNSNSVFLSGIERMFLPIAHAEGRIVLRDPTTAQRLLDNRQLGLCYAAAEQCSSLSLSADDLLDFPSNPNGSQFNLAGLSDATGRIFGLMPHPERFIDPTHHPYWTRLKDLPEHGEGRKLFENAVQFFA
jgi:phosphoribosylformylglycinamidine synthase subunit PurQ / glutaminase